MCRGLSLPNSMQGLKFFLIPNWSRLKDPKVWGDAAQQIFFSLSLGRGGLITLASYNDYHNNIFRDTLIIVLGLHLSTNWNEYNFRKLCHKHCCRLCHVSRPAWSIFADSHVGLHRWHSGSVRGIDSKKRRWDGFSSISGRHQSYTVSSNVGHLVLLHVDFGKTLQSLDQSGERTLIGWEIKLTTS